METGCKYQRLPTNEHDDIESENSRCLMEWNRMAFFNKLKAIVIFICERCCWCWISRICRRFVKPEASDEEKFIDYSHVIRANEQLREQRDVLEREKKEYKRKNEELTHKLDTERQARMNETRLSDQRFTQFKEDLKRSEAEKQDALTRLSALMSTKLRDNNPNIADLSDQFRPTKLAEMFSELYDNEWTDAFTAVNGVLTERQAITFLLDILMDAYSFCSQELDNSWRSVSDWYLDDSLPNEQQIKKLLKDSRKVVVVRMTQRISEIYKGNLESVCNIQTLHAMLSTEVVVQYVRQSVKLCLLMCANDPPVVIQCLDCSSTEPANNIQHDAADIASNNVEQSTAVISPTETQFGQETLERKQLGKKEFNKKDCLNNLQFTINEEELNNEEHSMYAENNGTDNEQIIRGERNADSIQTSHVVLEIEGSSVEHGYFNRLLFDRNMFKEYTTRGPYLEYIVWPVIYLHRGGPMLGKGVAQGTQDDVGRLEEEQWTWKKDY